MLAARDESMLAVCESAVVNASLMMSSLSSVQHSTAQASGTPEFGSSLDSGPGYGEILGENQP